MYLRMHRDENLERLKTVVRALISLKKKQKKNIETSTIKDIN